MSRYFAPPLLLLAFSTSAASEPSPLDILAAIPALQAQLDNVQPWFHSEPPHLVGKANRSDDEMKEIQRWMTCSDMVARTYQRASLLRMHGDNPTPLPEYNWPYHDVSPQTDSLLNDKMNRIAETMQSYWGDDPSNDVIENAAWRWCTTQNLAHFTYYAADKSHL
uniref:hypothetical protein n=1 Tax=Thaumasiovibrio occultus TaxID=1891184 RepID=UPI000B36126F|nr:hypothetical protein [Thaumasiovibrio occultus]